jgi:hypothetical protein
LSKIISFLCSELHTYFTFTNVLLSSRQVVYGANTIEVEVKSYWRLFIEEVSCFINCSLIYSSIQEFLVMQFIFFIRMNCIWKMKSNRSTASQFTKTQDRFSTFLVKWIILALDCFWFVKMFSFVLETSSYVLTLWADILIYW